MHKFFSIGKFIISAQIKWSFWFLLKSNTYIHSYISHSKNLYLSNCWKYEKKIKYKIIKSIKMAKSFGKIPNDKMPTIFLQIMHKTFIILDLCYYMNMKFHFATQLKLISWYFDFENFIPRLCVLFPINSLKTLGDHLKDMKLLIYSEWNDRLHTNATCIDMILWNSQQTLYMQMRKSNTSILLHISVKNSSSLIGNF